MAIFLLIYLHDHLLERQRGRVGKPNRKKAEDLGRYYSGKKRLSLLDGSGLTIAIVVDITLSVSPPVVARICGVPSCPCGYGLVSGEWMGN